MIGAAGGTRHERGPYVQRWWKYVGLAGIVGVAATGVAVARAERRRAAYTPDQVRDRLHERYKQANPGTQ
jgi:hypothetical protein